MKPKNYISCNKVLFNSKYIKTKKNQKLMDKFLDIFQVLQLIKK